MQDDRLADFAPTVLHADLWFEHLLVGTDGHLIGVIDFETVTIGDPAVDLSPQLYLGREFFETVLESYRQSMPLDKELPYRAHAHLVLREIEGLAWAVRIQSPEEIQAQVEKLRKTDFFG